MKIVKIEVLELHSPMHDLEIKNNHNFLANGIVVHNSNCRIVFTDDELHVGSRTEWKRRVDTVDADYVAQKMREGGCDEEKIAAKVAQLKAAPEKVNVFWKAVEHSPELIQWCKDHPNHVVYGECYGAVQKGFTYGVPNGDVRFAAFDIRYNGNYLEHDEARELAPNIPWVPVVYRGPFNKDYILKLIEQDSVQSTIPGSIMEGVVVTTPVTRWERGIGRLKFKFVSERYSAK